MVIGTIIGLAALGFGLFLGYLGLVSMRRSREVDSVPVSLAASIGPGGPGLVAVQGVARGRTVSNAPVSGTPCVYWETILYQYKHTGRSGAYEMVARDMFFGALHDFDVEDPSGRVPVLTGGADLEIGTKAYSTDGSTDPLPDAGANWVAQKGYDWHHSGFFTPLRVEERRIEEGGPIYVMGTPAPAPSDLATVNPSGYMICGGVSHADFVIGSAPKAVTERKMISTAVLQLLGAVGLVAFGIGAFALLSLSR